MPNDKFDFTQNKKPFNKGCELTINKARELAEDPAINTIDELWKALDDWNAQNVRDGIQLTKGAKTIVTRFENEIMWFEKEKCADGPYCTVISI